MRAWPYVTAMIVAVVATFAILGHESLASSSRAVLHGLCAQRPSHSFVIDGRLLPFDARMTGIYGGSLAAWIVLAARRRLLAAGTPPWPVIAVLAAGVLALALDGSNALLVDLGVWHPWTPLNATRYVTGFATGVALTTLEVWLIGTTLWRLSGEVPVWRGPRELWWVVPVAIAGYGVIRLDIGWSYPVVAVALMASAWLTVTALMLVIILSAFRLERQIVMVEQLEPPVVAGAVAALVVIIGLAQLRFWLERTLGIPQDFVATVVTPLASILT